MNDLALSYVRTYLERGWGVVPLWWMRADGTCACGRSDPEHYEYSAEHAYRQGGKHPYLKEWQRRLIRDEANAGRIWADKGMAPLANVGIATGAPSGFWVLDSDPEHGGDKALAQLEALYTPLPPTQYARTGSGGTHYRFLMPSDFEPTNRRGALPVGLDVRGTGGQCVVAPSVSGKGAYLEMDGALLDAPAWLLDLIRPAAWLAIETRTLGSITPDELTRYNRYAMAAVAGECDELAGAGEGTRDDTAFKTACRLHELINAPWSGLDPNDVERVFYAAAQAASDAGSSPFTWIEARRCWENGRKRVTGKMADTPAEGGSWIDLTGLAAMRPFVPTPPIDQTRLCDPLATSAIGAFPPITDDMAPPMITGTPERTGEYPAITANANVPPPGFAAVGAQTPLEPETARDLATEMLGRMLTATQLMKMAVPVPLINGLLDLDTTAWLIGKSGTYKSFLALDWAIHVAIGQDWYGYQVTQGPVVYIVAEGARGVALRVAAWERRYGQIGDNLLFLPEPVQAGSPEAWRVLVEVCRRLEPRLVVIDTQARVTIGLDENDNTAMMIYVSQADAIKRATGDLEAGKPGACVLTVHHIGRTGTDARGASSIDGAQDAELRIERQGDLRIMLHSDKQKDQAQGKPLDVVFERVAGEPAFDPITNRDLSSLVVSSVGDGETAIRQPEWIARLPEHQRHVLAVLRGHFAYGGGTKAEVRGVVNERWPSTKRTSFNTAWDSLVASSKLEAVIGTQRWQIAAIVEGKESAPYSVAGEIGEDGIPDMPETLADVAPIPPD